MTSISISGKVAYLISFSLIGIYNKKYRKSEGDFERGPLLVFFSRPLTGLHGGKGNQPEDDAGSSMRETQQLSTHSRSPVFAFLIISALIGRLFTREPIKVLITGWLLGLVSSTFGIVASGKGDLPAAPVIVVSLSVLFFFVLLFVALGRRTQ